MALSLALCSAPLDLSRAEDAIEKAGAAVELTAGNWLFMPVKALSLSMGVLSSGLSLVFFGGDTELAGQIWRDTTQGPYYITPELAKKSIGERPELLGKK